MPYHTHTLASDFAPKAWSAICQLLAPEGGSEQEGDDRISSADNGKWRSWSDGFIINLGKPDSPDRIDKLDEDTRLRNAGIWHVDGDFFVHYCKPLLRNPLLCSVKRDVLVAKLFPYSGQP
jgi:hypothetical protein